jgi:sulfur-oxidizing protein SoxY
MVDRREMLARSATLAGLLAGAGLLPGPALAAWNVAAFDARSLADVVKALGGAAPLESRDVSLTGPDIAENGAVVPLTVASALPGLRRLLILIEKNPALLAAVFEPGDAVEASFGTRVKMAQSSNVYAVAMMGDGKVLFAQKEIKVTLGGCG